MQQTVNAINGARSKTQRLKETFKLLCLMEPRLAADVTVNDFKSFEGVLNKVMQKKWMNDNNDIHEYTFKWHCNSGTPLNAMI